MSLLLDKNCQKGLGLIGVLLIIGAFIITAAGGVVVWKERVAPILIPTPVVSPTPATKISPFPTSQARMPWEDSVCGNRICEPCENTCCNYPCVTDTKSGQLMCPPPTCLGYCPQDCQEITPTPSPKPEFIFPTEYSCNNDSDCVLKDRLYCCGEKLEYYKWCYHKNVEPEVISCKGVGSCPGIVGSAKACACQNSKCTAIF